MNTIFPDIPLYRGWGAPLRLFGRYRNRPIALLTLPMRVRSTFHGMWVPESALVTGRYVA
jgi:hypothetical protein